jgi:hypothetical protein
MKINKSKLKNMVEKGAPAAPISIKRKRIDEGQSSVFEPSGPPLKRAPLTQATPSVPQPPLIIQIPDEEITVI